MHGSAFSAMTLDCRGPTGLANTAVVVVDELTYDHRRRLRPNGHAKLDLAGHAL